MLEAENKLLEPVFQHKLFQTDKLRSNHYKVILLRE